MSTRTDGFLWRSHKLHSMLVAASIMLLILGSRLYGLDLGPEYDQYGGWKAVTLSSRGFFSIGQYQGGYWFVSPEGHLFLSQGICHTGVYLLRPQVFQEKFGSDRNKYFAYLLDYYQTYKFNTLTYDHARELEQQIPYLDDLDLFGKGYVQIDYYDFFDPLFLREVTAKARDKCAKKAADRWLLGYAFTIHPLLWSPAMNPNYRKDQHAQNWIMFFKSLPAEKPGKRAYVEFMKRFHDSVDSYNKVHHTDFRAWDELRAADLSKQDNFLEAPKDDLAFYAEAIGTVTKAIAEAIRSVDKHHLIFGLRIARLEQDAFVKAFLQGEGPWIDASLPELYNNATDNMVTWLYQASGKPVLVADGMKITVKGGEERIEDWRPAIDSLLPNPYFLGGHICQFFDQNKVFALTRKLSLKPGVKRFDGTDKPIFTHAFREIMPQVYQRRLNLLGAKTR